MREVNHLVELETARLGTKTDPKQIKMEDRRRIVENKIKTFCNNAIYPQTLTLPRDPSTTKEGTFIFRMFKGRVVEGYEEQGVRCILQENSGWGNKAKARFLVSPLFPSEHDALSWARTKGIN